MGILKGFFSGTPEERAAIDRADALKADLAGRKPGRRHSEQIREGEKISRRVFFRKTGALALTGGGIVGVLVISVRALVKGIGSDVNGASANGVSVDDISRGVEGLDSSVLPKNNYHKIESWSPSSTEVFPRLIEIQDHWKQISDDSLAIFEINNKRASYLAQMMRDKAFYSIPMNRVVTQVAMKGKLSDGTISPLPEDGFEVVYMPEEYAAQMPSSIIVEPGGRTMRIATNFKCKEWLGIMLFHELGHVDDMMSGREKAECGEGATETDDYLAGEVAATKLEMEMLKAWSPEAYNVLINKGIPLLRSRNIQGIFQLIESLYPLNSAGLSVNEAALGTASCFIAIAFEDAMRNGATDEDLQSVYLALKKMFS